MKRAVHLFSGVASYLLSLPAVLNAIGFVEAVFAPPSVDEGGRSAPLGWALRRQKPESLEMTIARSIDRAFAEFAKEMGC